MEDIFLYNGPIRRGHDLEFINCVHENKNSNKCTVIMVSGGGDPDAAYKMARYLQSRYDEYSVIVSGLCKSAATLFAIGAKEIIFCPYGELGPLDIQLRKDDKVNGHESGLNIREAFASLEKQASDAFNKNIVSIIGMSGGVVTFKTASEVATKLVSALYGPIFSQIEPEEVGSRSRSMRIGEDYAIRLNCGNITSDGIKYIATKYSSHSFVIDMIEAKGIFKQVRQTNELEQNIIDQMGQLARFPQETFSIKKLDISTKVEDNNQPTEGKEDEKSKTTRKNTPRKKRSKDGGTNNKGNEEGA